MKKKGCLLVLFYAIGGVAALFLVSALAYSTLVSQEAKAYSLFHSRTIAFDSHYTTVPTGAWFDRVLTITLFTLMLWLLLWVILFILKKVTGKAQWTTRPAKGLFIGMLVLLGWSLLATLFVPKKKTVYNTAESKVIIKDYDALLYIWPQPFSASTTEIPFAQVKDFRFSHYESKIMGSSHDELELWLITHESDTVVVGSTLLYHGEFGWITQWGAKSEIIKAGKEKANDIAEKLLQLTQQD